MDGFDRFCAYSTNQTRLEKTSSVEDQRRRLQYPDTEYALIVENGPRRVRLFPMSSEAERAASFVDLEVAKISGTLSSEMYSIAKSQLDARAAGVSRRDGDALVYWDARDEEAWSAAVKVSEAPQAPALPVVAMCKLSGRQVVFRRLQELQSAQDLLERANLSSIDRRGLASTIVSGWQKLSGFDRADVLARANKSTRAWSGTEPRAEGPVLLRQRAQELEALPDAASPHPRDALTKASAAYRKLAELLEKESSRTELEDIANNVDVLDQLYRPAVARAVPAHISVFYGIGEARPLSKLSEASEALDGFIYNHGQTTIRPSEIVRFGRVARVPLMNYFEEALVDRFQNDPVATFQSMDTDQRRIVARLTEDLIKIRGIDRSMPELF